MIKQIYFDCETTGTNPYCAEIIEAYFKVFENGKFVDEYHLKSQVNFWCDDAANYHHITEKQMRSFEKKDVAFRQFLGWLPKSFYFTTYVNKNTELGHINFDVAILVNELNLLGCKNYYLENTYNMKHPESVHPLARQCANDNLYQPITQSQAYELGITKKAEHKSSNRTTYAQAAVYYALFGELYDAHNAIDDVNALVKIHKKLLQLQNENKSFFG